MSEITKSKQFTLEMTNGWVGSLLDTRTNHVPFSWPARYFSASCAPMLPKNTCDASFFFGLYLNTHQHTRIERERWETMMTWHTTQRTLLIRSNARQCQPCPAATGQTAWQNHRSDPTSLRRDRRPDDASAVNVERKNLIFKICYYRWW